MQITQTEENEKVVLSIDGKLDTITAPELENTLMNVLKETVNIELDCKKLLYISSAGLRVLLWGAKQAKSKNGAITLKNVSPDVMNIFELTGFDSVLDFN